MKTNEKVLELVKERLELGQKKYGQDIPLKGEGNRDNLKESVEEILDLTVYLGAVLLEVKNERDENQKKNTYKIGVEEISLILKGLHMYHEEMYRENQVQVASNTLELINNIKRSCKWNEEDDKRISVHRDGPSKCIEGSNCD